MCTQLPEACDRLECLASSRPTVSGEREAPTDAEVRISRLIKVGTARASPAVVVLRVIPEQ